MKSMTLLSRWRGVLITIVSAVLLLALVILIGMRFVESCSHVSCEIGPVMGELSDLQREVESMGLSQIRPKVTKDKTLMEVGYIDQQGTVVVVGKLTKLVVIARPRMEGTKIVWRCEGFPEKIVKMRILQDCGNNIVSIDAK